jgi:hypothetical protein
MQSLKQCTWMRSNLTINDESIKQDELEFLFFGKRMKFLHQETKEFIVPIIFP